MFPTGRNCRMIQLCWAFIVKIKSNITEIIIFLQNINEIIKMMYIKRDYTLPL